MPERYLSADDFEALHRIVQAFYQADRLSGTVQARFGLRTMADSDGNAVVDVYLSPDDAEAADTLLSDDRARHMQFLEDMAPAPLLGCRFVLKIEPAGPSRVEMTLLEVVPPALAR